MRFASLFAVFTLAASAFAAPVDPPTPPAPPPTPLPAIVNQLISQLTPLTTQLMVIAAAAEADVNALKPVTDQMTALINTATDDVKKLVGRPIDEVLNGVTGVLPISQAATLVANLVNLVIGSFGTILTVTTTTEQDVVVPFLLGVGNALAALLSVIVLAVATILDDLNPLLTGIINTLLYLNLATILNILGVPH